IRLPHGGERMTELARRQVVDEGACVFPGPVVHDAVELVAEEELRRVRGTCSVLPDQGCLREGRLHGAPELAPPRVSDLLRRVQTPAGRSELEPVPGHCVGAAEEEVLDRSVVVLEYRQCVQAAPAYVVGARTRRRAVDLEPAAVRGRRRLAGT